VVTEGEEIETRTSGGFEACKSHPKTETGVASEKGPEPAFFDSYSLAICGYNGGGAMTGKKGKAERS